MGLFCARWSAGKGVARGELDLHNEKFPIQPCPALRFAPLVLRVVGNFRYVNQTLFRSAPCGRLLVRLRRRGLLCAPVGAVWLTNLALSCFARLGSLVRPLGAKGCARLRRVGCASRSSQPPPTPFAGRFAP
jgi:hypothetical protein